MARRRIGQEQLAVGDAGVRGGTSLDEVAALIDWAESDRLLADISASAKGELGWPPLALFRALLLATWHDLTSCTLAPGAVWRRSRACRHTMTKCVGVRARI